MTQDRNSQAPVANAHTLSIEWLALPPGGRVSRHRLAEKQVLIAVEGDLRVEVGSGEIQTEMALRGTDSAWDSYALPADVWRSLRNAGSAQARVLVLTSGDHRKRIEWAPEVVTAATQAGWAIDANGFVAPKRFVDRAQR
jgi:quercetin dioxygenase-like cupin family protein